MISFVKTQKLFKAFFRARGLLNFVLWPHFKAVLRVISEPLSVVEECFRKSSQSFFQWYITYLCMITLGVLNLDPNFGFNHRFTVFSAAWHIK